MSRDVLPGVTLLKKLADDRVSQIAWSGDGALLVSLSHSVIGREHLLRANENVYIWDALPSGEDLAAGPTNTWTDPPSKGFIRLVVFRASLLVAGGECSPREGTTRQLHCASRGKGSPHAPV
jgi:hypothetical protein